MPLSQEQAAYSLPKSTAVGRCQSLDLGDVSSSSVLYLAVSSAAEGKGIVMGHTVSGVGHPQRVGEKVQPGTSKWGLQGPLGIAWSATHPRGP